MPLCSRCGSVIGDKKEDSDLCKDCRSVQWTCAACQSLYYKEDLIDIEAENGMIVRYCSECIEQDRHKVVL